jgi:trehalose 6-phosphate synthase/phosphatase
MRLAQRTIPVARVAERAPRVVIVANRLPVTVRVDGEDVHVQASSGGLATGLRGVHQQAGGAWIGWSGASGEESDSARRTVGHELAAIGAVSVPLNATEVAAFYQRFCNGVLWPVLHDRVDEAPTAEDWATYQAINARYADAVARRLRGDEQVWVHDYQLMLVPELLRARCPDVRIGFFLHTPFPRGENFAALPQAAALLRGMLGADLVGFHTARYVDRFASAVELLLGHRTDETSVHTAGRRVALGAFPMGIDAAAFARRADDGRVTRAADAMRVDGTRLLVGVDRLDYTKGIPQRLDAYARLLEGDASLRGRVRLMQLAVPSREEVPAYAALRQQVESLVTQINTRFGRPGWTPVTYEYGSVDDVRLSAIYRAADVMLVTPLCDGMNLVAKEFVASRTDGDGVLVLGAHAGAAAELTASLVVDPSDVGRLTDAYRLALTMPAGERRVRMRHLRARVHGHDVFRWSSDFLSALGS